MTTVGYGDRYPVTPAGRAVGAVLMLVGIALLGVVTASIAAAFVRWSSEPVEHEVEADRARERADMAAVLAELRALRADVRALQETKAPHSAE